MRFDLSFIDQGHNKESDQTDYPTKINRMGEIDFLKKNPNLGKNQPQSKGCHGYKKSPGGMRTPADFGPEKSHQSD